MKPFPYSRSLLRGFSTGVEAGTIPSVATNPVSRPSTQPQLDAVPSPRTHTTRIIRFLKSQPQFESIRSSIPEKYLQLKRGNPVENLYLIDENVAKTVVKHVLPSLEANRNQIVAETNAGLGLITKELLHNKVDLVRLYESCSEFRVYLKELHETYPGRIELFTKDIFLLYRYEFIDRQDNGNRVEQLLKGLPKKNWEDDPAMTIIGPLSNGGFLRFLIKQVVLQTQIISSGRFQLFTFMRPKEYVALTAGPHLDLHTYQVWSVLAHLLLDIELLEKFPKNIFLPWERLKSQKRYRYASTVDPDSMYFVKINFKKHLPVDNDNLLSLYLFVRNFFKRGTVPIIPTVEKIIPGSGLDILLPKLKHADHFKDMSIFTCFGELTPNQILGVFKEIMNHPEYPNNPILAMTDSQLIKTETIETDIEEQLVEKHIVDDFKVKLD